MKFWTLADLRDWSPESPIKLGVLGDPVAHSLSPPMQNAALAARGLPERYGRFHIAPKELVEALEWLRDLGFLGLNLTIPHKHAVRDHLGEIDEVAQRMGAVNTLAPGAAAGWRGWNTDGEGLARAVRAEFGAGLGELRVLVLGAGGGAGRAIAVQCVREGSPRVWLANRTEEKAKTLARELGLEVAGWNADSLAQAVAEVDLVINATSCGMRASDPELLPRAAFRPGLLIYDTIYYPTPTRLLGEGRRAGGRVANGLSMLLHQGALAFERWFGGEAPLAVMRAALEKAARG